MTPNAHRFAKALKNARDLNRAPFGLSAGRRNALGVEVDLRKLGNGAGWNIAGNNTALFMAWTGHGNGQSNWTAKLLNERLVIGVLLRHAFVLQAADEVRPQE